MALTPTGARTLLLALSDFWTTYVRDQTDLTAYAEGLALSAAQLYQRLLETALGQSLEDAPLFDRHFYRGYAIREDQLRYREGDSPESDAWCWATGDQYTSAEFLANRLLAPTALLVQGRDYRSELGVIAFTFNPFNVGGTGQTPQYFPVRTVRIAAPGCWTDPLSRVWTGVLPGDRFRITIGGAEEYALVTGVSGARVYLDSLPRTFGIELQRRSPEVSVLRTPFDSVRVNDSLSDHPEHVARLGTLSYDGNAEVGTSEINLGGMPYYRGAWVAGTSYSEGDLVDAGGAVWQARTTHVAGGGFVSTLWDNLATGYFYVDDALSPQYEGLWALTLASGPGLVALDAPWVFHAAHEVRLHRVRYPGTVSTPHPELRLPHTQIDASTLQVLATRAVPRRIVSPDGTVVTHPAGEPVREGVDFTLDARRGRLSVLSAWRPERIAKVNYSWLVEIGTLALNWRGVLAAGSYDVGDVVLAGDAYYVSQDLHVSAGVVDSHFVPWVTPQGANAARDVREVPVWAVDALLDEERLSAVFGPLLGFERPSSEPYRALLKGVSQLFLRGPAFEPFESALNAMAGLPLVREDGEVLQAYSSGRDADGAAEVFGQTGGHDGELVASAATFSAPTATFFSTDVGAELRVGDTAYRIATVLTDTTVEVAPTPPADAVGQRWTLAHLVVFNRLRSLGPYAFTEADVGGWIRLSGARAHNQGVFRISALVDPLTVVLDTTYGLWDEGPIPWEFSRDGLQRVLTDRREYTIPWTVPIRAVVSDPASLHTHVFQALDALTEAFKVVDYLEDPRWWHRLSIPRELFDAEGSRRTVTPALIEHIYGAIDGASYGDPGVIYGVDDDGLPGLDRAGPVTWYGGPDVVINWAPEVPLPRLRDVGTYLMVSTPGFAGHYKILSLTAGPTLRLEHFPPPEARGLGAPLVLDASLPPLLYRHTVGFVVMDRFLKYHCAQLRVAPGVELSGSLLTDAIQVIRQSTPSHVFLFFETPTTFQEVLPLTEAVTLGLNYELIEPLRSPVNMWRYLVDGFLRYSDWYRFADLSTSIASAPGTYPLPVVLPADPTAQKFAVKVNFDPAARVGGRRPVEGVDYDVDYAGCSVTIRPGVTLTPNPVTLYFVACITVSRTPPGPFDPGETGLVYGGSDPTLVRSLGSVPGDAGFLDRAIQLTLGP